METTKQLDRSKLEQTIALTLENYKLQFPAFLELIEDLMRCGRTVLFGGSVRDQIHQFLHGEAAQSRDLDFVVDGMIPSLRPGDQKNNFGGWRRVIGPELKLDYWELGGTYAFRKGHFPPAFETLPQTTVYTPNACIFDLQSRKLMDNGAVEDIARRTVAFNCRSYLDLFPDYQAFRAVDLAARLNYSLDLDVLKFVRERLHAASWDSFVIAVQRHRPDLSGTQIEQLCRKYR